ncbi:MAG: antirestriction protein ArdA [Nitrosospira sp.]|jgi:antirestriction protein|nr:antirestriction protein ArdA [Nitrosospira sp.]
MSDEIRIYVADLAACNNGRLHSIWINACDDINNIREQIKAMLTASPEGFAEEYAIHDYEGFGSYALSEYAGIETAHEVQDQRLKQFEAQRQEQNRGCPQPHQRGPE